MVAPVIRRDVKGWEGEQHVMQGRSIRRSGTTQMCQCIVKCGLMTGTRSAEGIMASGHVNRINRPNTWLHRPMLLREVLTCQPGAVRTWHLADIDADSEHVRFWG